MRPKTLLAYGDSNTYGTRPRAPGAPKGRIAAAWPTVLDATLGDGWRVIAAGQASRTTVHDGTERGRDTNGLTTLCGVLERHGPLDLVAVMLGTNDLKAEVGSSARRIAKDLIRLVAVIRGHARGWPGGAPAILLISPPPVLETGRYARMMQGGAARSQTLGAEVARQAARFGVSSFDAGSVIAVSPIDGIHFDETAHETLGRAVARKVREDMQC